MSRRIALALLVMLAAAAPAAAGDPAERKQAVDAQIQKLQQKLAHTRTQESALQREIAAVSGEIRHLEHEVGDVSERLAPLERELELREIKLNRLNALFGLQTARFTFLRGQYTTALTRLNARLVSTYETEQPGFLELAHSSSSFTNVIDGWDYVHQLAETDKRIADEVSAAKIETQRARARTKVARDAIQRQAMIVAVRVRQVRELRDELLRNRSKLEDARSRKKTSLDELSASERADAGEIDSLQQVSADLASRIRSAQAHSTVRRAASSGFIWPVNAPITSPFGWRWGRMHEGVDLGASYGAAIAAAASGTVIYAGWEGGYGNLVVIDHGGGIATAYGHQSRIAASVGQQVAQGQTIGYVGSTGHSTGPHLHFEVRVDGSAVDPLGYL